MMSTPFQSSVLRKQLDSLNGLACKQAYDRLQAYFGDRGMQARIVTMKEEEFQGPFLERLFGDVLGYTPKWKRGDKYDLVAEFKNVKDSKKADGVILRHAEEVHAVIELKGTDTIDLNRVEAQAFGYKVAHPDCRYVITSNFQRLRFYINDTTFYLEWNLFDCTYDDFRVLWLCLGRDQLLSDLPHQVRQASTVKEEEITKELYRDYTAFKRELFGHLTEKYPERDKLRLFQLSQKLLDRLLFVFFGEDKGLLPANTASKPIGDFDRLREIDEGKPLYTQLNKYFGYIDKGHQRKDWQIHAYNGGLFAPDTMLESLEIPDPILRKHLLKLTAYKFDSEVDVNILGHIFEHSLNEIEEVQAEIRGEPLDKSKTKRKKDGVFYTPRYITKYIVENTVGRLCTEKRTEIGIDEQDYARGRGKRRTEKEKARVLALRQNLQLYRDWLLDLKICDPACGSGAFLNEALDFLIREHENVSELERQLFDSAIAFDPGPSILENNLYGVDINDEAIEIARLSLWLRTAEPGRTLTDLSGRIKVGNSLIDDPEVAGDKAFVWVEEFPEVFGEGTRGGFDVVVGNPPYALVTDHSAKDLFQRLYIVAEGRIDLYELFYEKGLSILSPDGAFSYITPNTFLSNLYSGRLRKLLTGTYSIIAIDNMAEAVFEDPTVHTCVITVLGKGSSHSVEVRHSATEETLIISPDYSYKIDSGSAASLDIFLAPQEKLIFEQLGELETGSDILELRQCIKTGDDKEYTISSDTDLPSPWVKSLRGSEMERYAIVAPTTYIYYGDWLARNYQNKDFYERAKIAVRETGSTITAAVDLEHRYFLSSVYSVYPKANYETQELYSLLAFLSSTFATWYLHKIALGLTKGAFTKVRTNQLGRLPIHPKLLCDSNLQSLGKDTETQVVLADKGIQTFLRLLQRRFPLDKLTRKLEDWPSLDFSTFVKELNKLLKKVKHDKLSLTQELEWEPLFESKRAEVQALQAEITRLDREIDVAVYRLYGLSWEEVLVVDPGVQGWMGEGEYSILKISN